MVATLMTMTSRKLLPRAALRTYKRASSVVFLKTQDEYGALSNMAAGFPLLVCGRSILTSEALYQACRFPNLPSVQSLIIDQRSPMAAKMKSKAYRSEGRPDWTRVRVEIMRWCLRVKLAQNWHAFSAVLVMTGSMPIVEESRRDPFWGAQPVGNDDLVGMNVLGRLLMELRRDVLEVGRSGFEHVPAPAITDFLLAGEPIGSINSASTDGSLERAGTPNPGTRSEVGQRTVDQLSLQDLLPPDAGEPS